MREEGPPAPSCPFPSTKPRKWSIKGGGPNAWLPQIACPQPHSNGREGPALADISATTTWAPTPSPPQHPAYRVRGQALPAPYTRPAASTQPPLEALICPSKLVLNGLVGCREGWEGRGPLGCGVWGMCPAVYKLANSPPSYTSYMWHCEHNPCVQFTLVYNIH